MRETRLLDVKRLQEIIPRGRTTIWRMVKDGELPKPVRIGKNRIAWRSDEIQRWIDERERA